MTYQPSPTYAAPPQTAENAWAIKTPVGRAILLMVASFGLWGYWWFYDTRDKVNRELGKTDESALLYTFGLLVPILNIFIIYWLWRDISDLRVRMGMEEIPVVLYLVLSFIPFVALYTYPAVLVATNEYWDRRSNGAATESRVTGPQLWLTLAGAAVWVLYVLVIVIAIVAAAASSS